MLMDAHGDVLMLSGTGKDIIKSEMILSYTCFDSKEIVKSIISLTVSMLVKSSKSLSRYDKECLVLVLNFI